MLVHGAGHLGTRVLAMTESADLVVVGAGVDSAAVREIQARSDRIREAQNTQGARHRAVFKERYRPWRKAIAEAEGLDDCDWEKTYKGPAGGVITVRSEMGEPIHKLATRGVRFWSEMDQKIFSLDKAKRVAELKKQRKYIIQKLNDDFQKVWFGRNSAGQSVDLEDMTYGEVIRRMVDLMYVKHEQRWIDKSLARLTGDFMRRVEERFTNAEGKPSMIWAMTSVDPLIGKVLAAVVNVIVDPAGASSGTRYRSPGFNVGR